MRPLSRAPHRFRLSRAGIHQVWQYDEVFLFGDGRLLLRGKNGAGKSKALEMLLPFLLDGDTRKLDAAGGGKTTLKWLMLDGWSGGTNRLGYLWVEFARTDEEGRAERVTVGAAVRASTSTGDARPLFFVTRRAVGDGDGELPLHDPARRPSPAQLRDLVGADNCFDRAADYRARVARELFGLTDLARYRNLVHLLYGLRRPTIGDRIESGGLVKVLGDALPPLDDEVIDNVARNLDDLDTVRAELARLERTDTALTTFLTAYRGYLRGVLRGRVQQVHDGLGELRTRRREAGNTERLFGEARTREEETAEALETVDQARDAADADLRAIQESAAYGALKDLREKRTTVRALRDSAHNAWGAADLARRGEQAAAERLTGESEQIGGELTGLRGTLRAARRDARSCGVDEALLGEAPAARAAALAAPAVETLTDADERDHRVERPGASALDGRAAEELAAWGARLGEAGQAVKGRQRAAAVLAGELAKVADAEGRARLLGQDADRLDGQLGEARDRERRRGDHLVRTGDDYAARVREWARRLPEAAPLAALVAPGAGEGPVTERALPRETPDAVERAAHEAAEPVLATCENERDDALAVERRVGEDLTAAKAERSDWERKTDPEPPRSPYATAAHAPGTGAPLFLLLDFAATVGDAERAGLEAALEAAGLLSAWVAADGTVLAEHTREVLLRAGAPVAGPSLAEVLLPVPGHGVGRETIAGLLVSIGLGNGADAACWVAPDGRWRLGVARGAHGKERAEFVGAGVRAATRERRLAELSQQIEELTAALAAAHETRLRIEERRDALRLALREPPSTRELTNAWAAYDQAVAETGRLSVALGKARREAEGARAEAVRLRTRAEARATAEGLPADPEALRTLQSAVESLRSAIGVLVKEAERVRGRVAGHARTRAAWKEACDSRSGAEIQYGSTLAALVAARRELALLEETIGADEQQIVRREQDARHRFEQAAAALPRLRTAHDAAREQRVRAGVEREQAAAKLTEHEQTVVGGSARLRRPLGMPGLAQAAELGDIDPVLRDFDAAQEGDVRTRVNALRTLADAVAERLGPRADDVSDSVILRRGEELRDGLAGGYDAGMEENDGIKRFRLHDDTGTHDVAVVGERIRAAAQEARRRLSAREQEVFERYLLGELGDHLSRQVLAAHGLVEAMNRTLADVRSSHGIGARLKWELAADAGAEVRMAAGLLRHPSALRTREQSARLRDALRQRIEEARLTDPSAGYALHLRAALDYRSWFTFTVKVTDAAHPERERVLSHRTALSQGEQRVVSYLVLFATAAAHFSSLAGATPHAPRLILLDDAFAKVDEPTHGRLLGLLVELDLDFVITSERLWGCFATVPSLHIYECLRDPRVRGVATTHVHWDGNRRHHLASV
uniref:TIGR02680 family protein n=1 Tax=Actinomadura hibisca TaxID=68565 RepID=UPI000B01EB83|nr:TIGR02680 family protein [Actinomadura hibisca]